jgi:hypothetical protein
MNIELFLQIEPLISNGMSIFQMDKFVMNDSITPYRKLRQSLIEAKARLESLSSLDLDLEEVRLKKIKAEQEMSELQGIDQQLKEIQVRRYSFEINRKETHRQQLLKEAEFFLNTLTAIVASDLGGVENAIELLSDPAYHMQSEQDFWTKKLARAAFSDFVNYGTISKGTVESMACLSVDQQKEIINLAINQQHELSLVLNETRDTVLVERD